MRTSVRLPGLRLPHLLPLALLLMAPLSACDDAAEGGTGSLADVEQATLSLVSQINAGASPMKGPNELTISITNELGEAVLGAHVEVTPFMSIHGHGSPENAQVSELGEGQYKATNVVLHMAGPWEIMIRAESGEAFGEHELEVNVPG